MADNDFEIESVGLVYAQALANLAGEQNVLAEITDDMASLRALSEADENFGKFLGAATISDVQKVESLRKIFEGKLHPLTLQTLDAMARRERLGFLPGMWMAFEGIVAKLAGQVDVELVTAQGLSDAVLAKIKEAVARALKQAPTMTVTVDESLIGGMRLRMGDTEIDGSVATQLERLNNQLRTGGTKAVQEKMGSVVTA